MQLEVEGVRYSKETGASDIMGGGMGAEASYFIESNMQNICQRLYNTLAPTQYENWKLFAVSLNHHLVIEMMHPLRIRCHKSCVFKRGYETRCYSTANYFFTSDTYHKALTPFSPIPGHFS